ncbi:MAG: hypothetical protein KTR20_06130 [Cellvibrionaceae bacterium]|nr:hypothetical protein [Cellvibrionaceae bacterium]
MGVINSGVKQWVFQRIANAAFIVFGIILCVLLAAGDLSHAALVERFASSGLRMVLAVMLILACVNSILAGWQINGDYAKKFHLPRQSITLVALVVSGVYLVYGLRLLGWF